jgi:hypothetical protein
METLQLDQDELNYRSGSISHFIPLLNIFQAYLHSRMRAKTSDFIKVVNRAKPEQKTTEKKTIT